MRATDQNTKLLSDLVCSAAALLLKAQLDPWANQLLYSIDEQRVLQGQVKYGSNISIPDLTSNWPKTQIGDDNNDIFIAIHSISILDIHALFPVKTHYNVYYFWHFIGEEMSIVLVW